MLKLVAIIPKNAITDTAKLTRVIEDALTEAADFIKTDFLRTTGSWEHKPDFRIDKYPGMRVIYTDDEIYGYVSKGTRPHPIRPRNAKRLHFFRTGFRAKSRVNSLTSNKGSKATKDETFARGVFHPGNAARNFDTTVQKKWQKKFPQQVQQAIDTSFPG